MCKIFFIIEMPFHNEKINILESMIIDIETL